MLATWVVTTGTDWGTSAHSRATSVRRSRSNTRAEYDVPPIDTEAGPVEPNTCAAETMTTFQFAARPIITPEPPALPCRTLTQVWRMEGRGVAVETEDAHQVSSSGPATGSRGLSVRTDADGATCAGRQVRQEPGSGAGSQVSRQAVRRNRIMFNPRQMQNSLPQRLHFSSVKWNGTPAFVSG